MEGGFKCIVDLHLVTEWTMGVLAAIDPIQHEGFMEVLRYRVQHSVVQQAISAVDPGMLYEGREVVFNRSSAPHFDKHDPPPGVGVHHLHWHF